MILSSNKLYEKLIQWYEVGKLLFSLTCLHSRFKNSYCLKICTYTKNTVLFFLLLLRVVILLLLFVNTFIYSFLILTN